MTPTGLPAFVQELREMGLRHTLFRVRWELESRSGLMALRAPQPPALSLDGPEGRTIVDSFRRRLPFTPPAQVHAALHGRIPHADLSRLWVTADEARRGRILCFGRWRADYGDPIDWHLHPQSGLRWPATCHWTRALREQSRIGDVKQTWEVGRFPQAYHMGRAATFFPDRAACLTASLRGQIGSFVAANRYARGIHWSSGQEVAFRLMAWVFALRALLVSGPEADPSLALVAQEIFAGACHIERHIDYARLAVYNNHLLSEALGLYLAGTLLPGLPEGTRWSAAGRALLTEQAERQFYGDGAYIQHSHNYHRLALQDLLWACALARSSGHEPASAWIRAMDRSLLFLVAHQSPSGSLPNYGANDGALPSVLSVCDYTDFRPTLQAVSVAARGERLYEPGPWDEEAVWFFGPDVLHLPLRPAQPRSVSFRSTGYHVMRGIDRGSFSALRCGSLTDRFSQIDMLHLDVWWRGHNVLVDGGSFLYNGPREWHDHFVRTASHNTASVDGRDQMLHYRQFKCIYWTKAALLHFEDMGSYVLCSGEHYGYRRHPGSVVHRRHVIFVKDDLWVVVDHIAGTGEHQVRLHWLGAAVPHETSPGQCWMELKTPAGAFQVVVLDDRGASCPGDVVSGQNHPPRGWLSRYYGEKVAAPSLVAEHRGPLPMTRVSILSPAAPRVEVSGHRWRVQHAAGIVQFALHRGEATGLHVRPADPE